MPITGTAHALMHSRLGLARLGAARLDYFQPVVVISLYGVVQTGNVHVQGCQIQQSLDGDPDTCQLTVSGITPVAGNRLTISLGQADNTPQHTWFKGVILKVKSSHVQNSTILLHEVDAQDATYLLNHRKVTLVWPSTSISQIVSDVMFAYANSTITGLSTDIETNLPIEADFTATNEDVTDVLDRLAALCGAHWWIDSRTLYFTTQAQTGATPITDGMAGVGYRDMSVSSSISDRQTYVTSRGGGGSTLIRVPWGIANSFPVSDASMYLANGQLLGTVSNTAVGSITWFPELQWTGLVLTYQQAVHVPQGVSTLVVNAAAALATNLVVSDASAFPNTGWAEVSGMYFRYTSKTNLGGSWRLSGIPANTGYGSLLADVQINDVVTAVPSILGITSGLLRDIPAGEQVYMAYLAIASDARTDFAARLGAGHDGAVEGLISDGRISADEALSRAVAFLTTYANSQSSVSFTTRDKTMNVGREVSVNLSSPSVNGTFLIQSVTIDMSEPRGRETMTFPVRMVDAASRRITFERLIKRLKNLEGRT